MARINSIPGRSLVETIPIDDLSDVDTTGKSTGKVLKYNSVSGKWEVEDDNNTTYTAGTGLSLVGTQFSADITYFDGAYLKLDQTTPQTISASPVLGWMTNGSIPFIDSSGYLAQDNARLTWNDTSDTLFSWIISTTALNCTGWTTGWVLYQGATYMTGEDAFSYNEGTNTLSVANITSSATIQAEQLTSTDDITLAGQLNLDVGETNRILRSGDNLLITSNTGDIYLNADGGQISFSGEELTGFENLTHNSTNTVNYMFMANGTSYIPTSPANVIAGLGTDARYLIVDTRANILADISPITGKVGYSTDYNRFYIYDGTDWRESATQLMSRTGVDMGAEPNSSLDGYGENYVTDKLIANCTIGSNSEEEEGSIRTNSGYYQIYLNGVWNDVVINFRFREDSSGAYELEHKPIGLNFWYEIMSGNSDMIGIDGKPIFQQYSTNMGAMQSDLIISGGTF